MIMVPALNLFLFFCRATLLGMRHAWVWLVNSIPVAVLLIAALAIIAEWFRVMLAAIPHTRWILFH